SIGRKQRLVIVRPVKINQIVTKFLEIRQGSRRAIDELAIGPRQRETSFQNQIASARFNARFLKPPIPFCAIIALTNCFYRAWLRSGAKKRFVSALAEQQLERANDDRFTGARLAGNGSEARSNFPFQILNQGEIFNS